MLLSVFIPKRRFLSVVKLLDSARRLPRYRFLSTQIKQSELKELISNIAGAPPDDLSQFSSKESEEERLRKAKKDAKILKLTTALLGVWAASALAYALIEWGSPPKDELGKVIEDEFSKSYPSWLARIVRTCKTVMAKYEHIKDPTSDKLLPDPVEYPLYQPPYTLVIEHSGILVHPEWSYKSGWRYKKRPGLEYFMSKVGYPVFELVIYTQESSLSAAPILHGLDGNGKIFAALFRENTRYRNGAHIKDLSCLNRDLSKVIIVDWDSKAYQLQPRNAIHRLKEWKGDDNDTTLIDLADFLQMIANSGVPDVRDVLDHYNQEENPIAAFSLKQQKLVSSTQQETPVQKQSLLSRIKKNI